MQEMNAPTQNERDIIRGFAQCVYNTGEGVEKRKKLVLTKKMERFTELHAFLYFPPRGRGKERERNFKNLQKKVELKMAPFISGTRGDVLSEFSKNKSIEGRTKKARVDCGKLVCVGGKVNKQKNDEGNLSWEEGRTFEQNSPKPFKRVKHIM